MVTRSLAKTSPIMRTARARSLDTRPIRRSTRSARTPASGLALVGNRRATSAPPTAEALLVICTFITTSATTETASPTNEVPWPIQSRKKRAFLKRESLVESIPPRIETHYLAPVGCPPGDRAATQLNLWRRYVSLASRRPQPDVGPMGKKRIQSLRCSCLARQLYGQRSWCRRISLLRRHR